MKLPTASHTLQTAIFVLLFSLAGCGYHDPYSSLGNGKDVTIYIDKWSNQTAEFGLEAELYQEINRWLKRNANIQAVKTAAQAQYGLYGTIDSIHLQGHAYDKYDRAKEIEAEVKVSFRLKAQSSGETIFAFPGMIFHQSYPVSRVSTELLAERKKALSRLLYDLGEFIYLKTIESLGTATDPK